MVQSVRGLAIKRLQNQRVCLATATRVRVDREVQSLAQMAAVGPCDPVTALSLHDRYLRV